MNKIVREDIKAIIASGIVDWERFRNKTVLITGASGMLPSYMALTLLALNEEWKYDIQVMALVRNKKKAESVFKDYLTSPCLRIIIQDVSQQIMLDEKVDYIIHAASQASPKYYGTDPVGTLNANIIGTHNLLEYARDHSVEGFLFFSTGGVYGNFPSQDLEIKEDKYGLIDPLNVRSCYFESKKMAENMCACYAYQYGVPTKIIRIFHTLGPNIDINDGRAFSDFCKAIVENNDIVLRSDGSAKRTFLYVSDAIPAYFKVLLDGDVAQAYNVGSSSQEISMRDLAKLLVSLFPEKNLKVVHDIDPESITYTKMKNPVNRVIPNTDKMKALGWKESMTVKDAFVRTIDSKVR